MSERETAAAINLLAFGGTVLLVSIVGSRIADKIGRGFARVVGVSSTAVALLVWVAFFMPPLHGPLLFDVVFLSTITPLVGCGSRKGAERRAFFLAAAAAQTVALCLDVAGWRFGLFVPDGVWLGVFLLLLLGPAVCASMVHGAYHRAEVPAS